MTGQLADGGDAADAVFQVLEQAARSMVRFYAEPEKRAFVAGCILAAPFTRRMRVLPGILFCMIGGYAAQKAWIAAADLHAIAAASGSSDADPAGP